jgi:CYTH domain-containing protein
MGTEIERKFLVNGDSWREGARGTRFQQGYLSSVKERTVRVRVAGERAFLTIKGKSVGATRSEYEYEIPLADARELLAGLCERPLIEKTRYEVDVAGLTWEVDVFEGENQGLVVAEIELESESQPFTLPAWAGAEVTSDPRYFNASLIKHPFSRW